MTGSAYILPSAKIDAGKWDDCVRNSGNGLIYACTEYLTAMADQWHGIVIDEYRAVMPIPWRIRFGIRYAYMPSFTQQLGLIGSYTKEDIQAVMRTLPDFISFGDIHFNFLNTGVSTYPGVVQRTNFVIDLSQDHGTIYSGYRKDLKENIKKHTGTLTYTDTLPERAISFYEQQYSSRIKTQPYDYHRFYMLCHSFEQKGQCLIRAVSDENGELLATAVLVKDNRRIYNLMNTTLPAGRQKDANDILLNCIMKEFSGQPLLFDFEGSELPGVKEFYKKFGALTQPYFHYHFNGLPWHLRWLKR